jgi:phosphotransferase system HPr (HPr) family protein
MEKKVRIRNAHGIHCRPSAVIVKECAQFAADMTIACANGEANPKSIIAIIALGMSEGDEATVSASGADEEAACQRLAELLETHFDFPPREPGQSDSDLVDNPNPA